MMAYSMEITATENLHFPEGVIPKGITKVQSKFLSLITNRTVTSALQCCFHTLFGSCRPTAGGRVTLKPHVPSWDLYSAIKVHRKEKKCINGASSWKLVVR